MGGASRLLKKLKEINKTRIPPMEYMHMHVLFVFGILVTQSIGGGRGGG